MTSENNIQKIRRVTVSGVIVNLALSVLKFIVGIIGSSQAVVADAVHSLSDLATDFAVLFGVKYWSAPPDEDHPYGHLRIEALITALIGFALAGVAIGLGAKAIGSIREVHLKQTAWIALIGPALSIILKEWLYRWTVNVGKQVKSMAMVANAWHHRSDALSSVPAVIAVTASAINPRLALFDHIGAIIISLFILKVSWDIIKPSLAELTDRGASQLDRDLIRQFAFSIKGVKEVHKIRTRKFGSDLHVDLHILVDPDMSVRKGHDISEQVKKTLIENGPNILDVVVHLEPFE